VKKGWQEIYPLLLSLILIVVGGTLGYMIIERMRPLDALFLSIITLSTVGFGLLQPLSGPGKLWTIGLIVVGVAVFSYHLTRLFSLLVEKGFLGALERRRMDSKIEGLSEHFIVCGHGRIGSVVVQELMRRRIPMVVLENDPSVLSSLEEQGEEGIFFLQADAKDEGALKRAGIERAKGLVALLPTDADNLYIILTAKDLNPGLTIFARACDPRAERRLLKAGASHVISPHREGAKRIARMILNPNVTDFVEMATERENLQLQMEEFVVQPESPLAGKSLHESGLLRKHRILVVAIKGADGAMTFNPEGGTTIAAGDSLIVLGPAMKAGLFQKT
jgi:voltage-gated potassium channel